MPRAITVSEIGERRLTLRFESPKDAATFWAWLYEHGEDLWREHVAKYGVHLGGDDGAE